MKAKNCHIDHVALYALDLEAMRDFFVHFFQASANKLYHNPKKGFSSYFLTFGDEARLEIMSCPGMQDVPRLTLSKGYAHIAFGVGGKRQVDQLTKALIDGGYALLDGPRTTGDGYYESTIRGPEDLLIEITE